jgi:hypothetical protein
LNTPERRRVSRSPKGWFVLSFQLFWIDAAPRRCEAVVPQSPLRQTAAFSFDEERRRFDAPRSLVFLRVGLRGELVRAAKDSTSIPPAISSDLTIDEEERSTQ